MPEKSAMPGSIKLVEQRIILRMHLYFCNESSCLGIVRLSVDDPLHGALLGAEAQSLDVM